MLRLKEWVAKKAEKEKEREEKRKERMKRRRAVPNHKFDDPLYDKQRAVVAENQEDALQIGKLSIQNLGEIHRSTLILSWYAGMKKANIAERNK